MVSRFLQLSHSIQSVKFMQTIIYQGPSAVLCIIYLAFPVIGTTARPVHKSLVTGGNRTNAAGFTKNAVPALEAYLIKLPNTGLFTDKKCIQGRHNQLFKLSLP